MIIDPIGDMLARINNAIKSRKSEVYIPNSKMKQEIARILKEEGYIEDYMISEKDKKGTQDTLIIKLKYLDSRNTKPVISGLKRVSKPGLRKYAGVSEIPYVRKGLGTAILSTNKGILTDAQARKERVGGEILCYIW